MPKYLFFEVRFCRYIIFHIFAVILLFKNMIVVNIKDNESIDRALKRFKKKFEKTGALRELRSRTFFTKPSVVRREQIKKAAYIQSLRDLESK